MVTLNQRIFLIGHRNSVGKTKDQIELTSNFSEGDFVLTIELLPDRLYLHLFGWPGNINIWTLDN